MNIFVLDEEPTIAAVMHCDKHCNKMIVEHTQMMSAAYYSTIDIYSKKESYKKQEEVSRIFKGWPRKNKQGLDWPYSITHVNHPCTIWTRSSIENFNWVLSCTEALCQQFELRWKHEHSIKNIVKWMKANPPKLPSGGLTSFAKAVPDCLKALDPVEGYRRCYALKTLTMKVEWQFTEKPNWWSDSFINETLTKYKV